MELNKSNNVNKIQPVPIFCFWFYFHFFLCLTKSTYSVVCPTNTILAASDITPLIMTTARNNVPSCTTPFLSLYHVRPHFIQQKNVYIHFFVGWNGSFIFLLNEIGSYIMLFPTLVGFQCRLIPDINVNRNIVSSSFRHYERCSVRGSQNIICRADCAIERT